MKGVAKPKKDKKKTISGCTKIVLEQILEASPLHPTWGFKAPSWLPGDYLVCYHTLAYDRQSYDATNLIWPQSCPNSNFVVTDLTSEYLICIFMDIVTEK